LGFSYLQLYFKKWKKNPMNILQRFLKAEGGAFTAIFAVIAPVIIAGAGLAVDVGFWYSSKRDLQNAADAGALAGGYELLRTNSQSFATSEAIAVSTKNSVAGAQVTVLFPTSAQVQVTGANGQTSSGASSTTAYGQTATYAQTASAPSNSNSSLVQVTVRATAQTFFIGHFLSSPPVISATATAKVDRGGDNKPPACLNLLDGNGEGLRLNGNARVEVGDGCDVHVNSSDERAIVVNGESRLISSNVCVVGGVVAQSPNSISSVPVTCPAIPNPYAHLEPFLASFEGLCEDDPRLTLDAPVRNNRGGQIRGFLRAPTAGIETQFTISNGGSITFEDRFNRGGPYPICHDILVKAGGTLKIKANMMFLNGARLKVQAGGNVEIRAPEIEVPELVGMSIVAPESNTSTFEIKGGGSIFVTSNRGISVPGAAIDINGNSRITNSPVSNNLGVVSITAKNLIVGGSSEFKIGPNPVEQPIPPRQSQAADVQLIN
jgi:Flp pilus assembly protein TadG